MDTVDFLHHEDSPTCAGVKPATIGAEGHRQTNYAFYLASAFMFTVVYLRVKTLYSQIYVDLTVENIFFLFFPPTSLSIPLSNDTVSRRIDDIAEDVEQQLFGKLRDKLFSIQLDEATDSNKDAHFIAYVRFWDETKPSFHEALLIIPATSQFTRGLTITVHGVCSRRRRIDEADINTLVAVDQRAVNYQEKPVR
ncbi:uncharacterized protein TNCV_4925371 [Trichonephila clavipes]|nr:uncharacterized protein TNCV_4925371 [Trichonephila clavipes]